MFDTDDVVTDVMGNKKIIDVSIPEKAKAMDLKGRTYFNAVSPREDSYFEVADLNHDSVTIKVLNSVQVDKKTKTLGRCNR